MQRSSTHRRPMMNRLINRFVWGCYHYSQRVGHSESLHKVIPLRKTHSKNKIPLTLSVFIINFYLNGMFVHGKHMEFFFVQSTQLTWPSFLELNVHEILNVHFHGDSEWHFGLNRITTPRFWGCIRHWFTIKFVYPFLLRFQLAEQEERLRREEEELIKAKRNRNQMTAKTPTIPRVTPEFPAEGDQEWNTWVPAYVSSGWHLVKCWIFMNLREGNNLG